jgi:hypothetical protein
VLFVVDDVVRSERLGFTELFVGRGRDNDRRPHRLRELKRENGNAAGPKEQDSVAGLQFGGDQRTPSGCARCGNRGALNMVEMARRAREPVRRADDILPCVAIDAISGRPGETCRRWFSLDLLRKKARDNGVALAKLGSPCADGLNCASTVRQQNSPGGARQASEHDVEVMVVQ